MKDLSVPDGKICLNEQGELAVTKFAVEPVISNDRVVSTQRCDWADESQMQVWYLPGVAERFGIGTRSSRGKRCNILGLTVVR